MRFNQTLDLMNNIIQLDYHYDEILGFIEQNKLEELELTLSQIAEALKTVLRLPQFDNHRDKGEKIYQAVREKLESNITSFFKGPSVTGLQESEQNPVISC